jgi:glycerophosphoryl diester phosphodiesterase
MSVIAAFLAIVLSAAAPAPTATWNVRDHIPLEDVTVQSHRGAGVLMPENSQEAFQLAWKLGTVPEADLRTSRDGVIVAFHDDNFERILPGEPAATRRQGIADRTWDELAKFDIGAAKGPQFASQRIPRMTDVYAVLKENPRHRLYIDFKNVDLEQLAKESAAVHSQLILASTDYKIIRLWKSLAPASATLHWMGGTEEQLRQRIEDLRKTSFADITQLQIHVRFAADGTMTPSSEFLVAAGEELRSHGILYQVFPWDRKDPEIFWQMMDLGVASFATDYPDVAMQAIRDYYADPREGPKP